MTLSSRNMLGLAFDSYLVVGVLPDVLLVRLTLVGASGCVFTLDYGTRGFLPSYPVYY